MVTVNFTVVEGIGSPCTRHLHSVIVAVSDLDLIIFCVRSSSRCLIVESRAIFYRFGAGTHLKRLHIDPSVFEIHIIIICSVSAFFRFKQRMNSLHTDLARISVYIGHLQQYRCPIGQIALDLAVQCIGDRRLGKLVYNRPHSGQWRCRGRCRKFRICFQLIAV